MVHRGPMYSDADTAALYDRLNPWDREFALPVMASNVFQVCS